MSNTVEFIQSYKCNKVGDSYESQLNGSCLTLEYTVNGNEVRFIITRMDTDYANRFTRTTMVKEVKDELGNWKKSGEPFSMKLNDQYFINTVTGESVHYSKAYNYVDDLDKPIPDTDPVEYEKKPELKDNLVNEVDYMIQANSELFSILEVQAKTKINKIYS